MTRPNYIEVQDESKGDQGMIWGYKSSIHAVHYISNEVRGNIYNQ
ncbi:hypothetical protein [Paenibacillus assamensis]|nr:hypothetical protein [Paenibacillus assamensis]